MKSIRKETISGISWNGLQTIINQVFGLVIGIILARLLPPETFGLVAMILVFTGFAGALQHFGFQSAIIQRKVIKEEHLSSVFWINLITGVLLWLIFTLLASSIANFYGEPSLTILIYVFAFNFIFGSLYSVPTAILQKQLAFKQLAIANIISSTVAGLITILLAVYHFGVWALIFRVMFANILLTIVFFFQIDWRPKYVFNITAVKDLFYFGFNVTANSLLFSFTKEIDSLIIGKQLGASSLGIYNKAYTFLMFPIEKIKSQVMSVIFPVFSILQEEKGEIKDSALNIFSVMGLVIFPMMLGVYSISEEFVLVFLGDAWVDMIPIMKIFCLAALFDGIKISGTILLSLDKSKDLIRLSLFTKPLSILLIIIGLNWGLLGVAKGVLLGIIINFLIESYIAGKYIALSLFDILKVVLPVLLLSSIMLFTILLAGHYFMNEMNLFYRMILKILLGAGVFFFQLFLFRPKPLMLLFSMKSGR